MGSAVGAKTHGSVYQTVAVVMCSDLMFCVHVVIVAVVF